MRGKEIGRETGVCVCVCEMQINLLHKLLENRESQIKKNNMAENALKSATISYPAMVKYV